MTITQMLEQSAILTVLGMAVVFVFLWIMILCVNLTGKFIHRMGLDKDVNAAPQAPARSGVKPETAAVISAAINEYQKDNP
ncbi:MAG: OadG family protein [Treponema sp.]|jgi:oxaloacetate decarboxylase gamma subunit|nr:OadG family protein [Treponema sp.]